MANRFYFAYGSNMNPDRIRERIPQARVAGTAFILGWRLKERLYADIERSRGGRVCGVLYLLTQTEILHLDAYEGYPRTYGCVELDAMIDPEHKVSAFTYVLTVEARREREGKKYPESYRLICSAGAQWHGIRDEFGRLTDPPFTNFAPGGVWIPSAARRREWLDASTLAATRNAKAAAKKPARGRAKKIMKKAVAMLENLRHIIGRWDRDSIRAPREGVEKSLSGRLILRTGYGIISDSNP